jgi:N-hydroxyarylamine O-acetyltransferase
MRFDDYLRRISASAPSSANVDALHDLHRRHRDTFLFENLDIQRGRGIDLSLEALERKFLDEGRGGYCFEQNTLFDAALREVGFDTRVLLARVRRGPPAGWSRTHMLLLVTLGGERWIADVGFGAAGLLEPMQFEEGATSEQGGLTYSLRRDGELWVLDMRDASGVDDFYEFALDRQTPADVEIANHYTSTHPASIFRRSLTIQRARREERTILRGNLLARYRGGVLAEEPFASEQLRNTAQREFAVDLGDGPFVFESYA